VTTAVLISHQGLNLQRDGESQYVRSFKDYLESQGYTVISVVPNAQSGEMVSTWREDASRTVFLDQRIVRVPGLPAISIAGRKTMAFSVAWKVFERLPRRLQRRLDQVRTDRRAKRGVDYVVGKWMSESELDALRDSLHKLSPDLIVIFRLFVAPRPNDIPSGSIALMVSEECVSDRIDSMRSRGFRCLPADLTAAVEAELLVPWPTLAAIQWDEQRRFQELVPGCDVLVVPYAREVALPSIGSPTVDRPQVVFVGSGASTNVDAVEWFLENCWPEIGRRHPTAEFHVVGSVCWRIAADNSRVVLRGFVDDVDAAIASAHVVVVPLQAGTGLKVKVIDALAAGGAIVTTSIGAQGLLALEPRPFVIADDPVGFVDAVDSLLGNEAERSVLQERARTTAERFTPESAFSELRTWMIGQGLPVSHGTEVDLPAYCGNNHH
jgi:glycosyltransferase involved in cell wall biosynthesis